MITVTVKSFLEIRDLLGTSDLICEIEEGSTVEALLLHLADNYGHDLRERLFNPNTNEIRSDYMILVNGTWVTQLPKDIHTALMNGDKVSILLYLAGG
jgi:MoaD family protein